eukprot:m.39923 g.39923  ORF g.39923 m.39923 type:complete len:65 (-) comp12714_c0_seq4:1044-1238(-)
MADDYTLSKDCNLGWHQQGMVALVVYDCGRRVSVASSIARLFPVDSQSSSQHLLDAPGGWTVTL